MKVVMSIILAHYTHKTSQEEFIYHKISFHHFKMKIPSLPNQKSMKMIALISHRSHENGNRKSGKQE